MKRYSVRVRRALLFGSLLLALAGCDHKPTLKNLSVEQVAAGLQSGALKVYDANIEDFRQRQGVIPGATLLRDPVDFDLEVLPKDKQAAIAFYCVDKL